MSDGPTPPVMNLPRVKLRIEKLVASEIKKRQKDADQPRIRSGVERVTLAGLRGHVADTLTDLTTVGFKRDVPESWPVGARDEVFLAVQMAWAATAFRIAPAAELLGVDRVLLDTWLQSKGFDEWTRDTRRRVPRLAALADIAMQRAAEILMIETQDPKVMNTQAMLIRAVLAGGVNTRDRPALLGDPPAAPEPPEPPDEAPLHSVAPPSKPVIDVE